MEYSHNQFLQALSANMMTGTLRFLGRRKSDNTILGFEELGPFSHYHGGLSFKEKINQLQVLEIDKVDVEP